MSSRLPVVEIFGPTIQGEGALAGHQTHFVRLGGCDFRCSWCDSMHAVDPQQWTKVATYYDPCAIVEELIQLTPAPWVTISGGNPGMYGSPMGELVEELQSAGFRVAVETQATIWRPWMMKVEMLTMSPKPPSAGVAYSAQTFASFVVDNGINRDTMAVKVVIDPDNPKDWKFLEEIHDFVSSWVGLALGPPAHSTSIGPVVYVQTVNREGSYSPSDQLATFRKMVEELPRHSLECVVAIPQIHALLWGSDLGR